MRNIILTIGALTLFTASPAFADSASQTIGGSQEAASLATGGGARPADGGIVPGMGEYIIGDDDRAFSLAGEAGMSTGAPVSMLPAFAEDGRKTIGNDDQAFSSVSSGS